mgnify:CR=1 FL=1
MASDIQTATVAYDAGGATLNSYLAWDALQRGPRPGIVLFGEWWGLNDWVKDQARALASTLLG